MPNREPDVFFAQFDNPVRRPWESRRRRLSGLSIPVLAITLLAVILGGTLTAPLPRMLAASSRSTAFTCSPAPSCPTTVPPSGAVSSYPDVFYGAPPPGGGLDKPVLLFVHGLGATAMDWWGGTPTGAAGTTPNDMYTDAWSAGYRTAFVELTPIDPATGAKSPEADAFTNAITLSQQIITITQAYQVPWLDVIAHSKGGVDTNTAIAYDNPQGLVHVRNVITLATPHWGTPLADFVCANPSIAQLLGLNDGPGLCGTPGPNSVGGLTVAEMQAYRAQTDAMTPTVPVTYFVAAGADWQDTTQPAIFLGGELLQVGLPQYGAPTPLDPINDNDGLVPVESACSLPHSNYLFVKPFNHLQIFTGDSSWSWISLAEQGGASVNRSFYTAPYSPTLYGGPGPAPCAFYGAALPGGVAPPALNGSSIIQSGLLSHTGSTAVALPIETKVQLASLHLIVSSPNVSAALIDPSGVTHRLPTPSQIGSADGGVFGTSSQINYQMTAPRPGTWHLKFRAPTKAAYLLNMAIESPLKVTLAGLPEGALLRPGQIMKIQASVQDSRGSAHVENLSVHVTGAGATQIAATRSTAVFRAPKTPGGMIMTATVTGKAADGSTFERSFVRSLAVVAAPGGHAVPRQK